MAKQRGDSSVWRKKYTLQQSYAEYIDMVGKERAVPKAVYVACMKRFMWKLSRIIILHKYEWKMPEMLGFIRIAKKQTNGKCVNKKHLNATGEKLYQSFYLTHGWKFYWFWDRNTRQCRIFRKKTWEFSPVVDWKAKKIGQRGLQNHVIQSALDPRAEDYDVINRRHL